MNTIPMAEFQKLSTAMSRCKIRQPNGGVSRIVDRNDNWVGEINWNTASISIYEDYEYCNEVLGRLGKFADVRKEFEEPDVPVEINKDPTLTDRGKLLYDRPREMEKEMVDKFNSS